MVWLLSVKRAGKPEVSHFYMAFRVQQKVTWLKVAMQQVCRVHVLKAFKHLIDYVLLVDILKDVGADNCMEISVHKIEHEVDVAVVLCTDYVLKADDVLVAVQLL